MIKKCFSEIAFSFLAVRQWKTVLAITGSDQSTDGSVRSVAKSR